MWVKDVWDYPFYFIDWDGVCVSISHVESNIVLNWKRNRFYETLYFDYNGFDEWPENLSEDCKLKLLSYAGEHFQDYFGDPSQTKKITPFERFSRNFIRERINKKITQYSASIEMDVKVCDLRQFEDGCKLPSFDFVKKYSKYLGLNYYETN